MQTKSKNPLPKTTPLPGSVCPQYQRCGKPNCHCREGEPHGPYYFRFWRQQGRLCKTYVQRGDVEEVKQACALHRAQQAHFRAELKRSREEFQRIRRLLKQI